MCKEDLNFKYRSAENGSVTINHNGKLATTLRGRKAISFIDDIETLSFSEQQQLMARVTGNYKRGNERVAKNHSRSKI